MKWSFVGGVLVGFVAGMLAQSPGFAVGGVGAENVHYAAAQTHPYLEEIRRYAALPHKTAGCSVPSEPQPDLSLKRITKQNRLPQGYVPGDLVRVPEFVRAYGVVCVTKPTAAALSALFAAAGEDGVVLEVFSGYRGPREQAAIRAKWRGLDKQYADRAVAPPHHSEHHTGTAVDLTGASVGFARAKNGFERSQEYRWLEENAWKYGFNLSYPKRLLSGELGEYRFEPWHWRYVGVAVSKLLNERGISYNELQLVGWATGVQ